MFNSKKIEALERRIEALELENKWLNQAEFRKETRVGSYIISHTGNYYRAKENLISFDKFFQDIFMPLMSKLGYEIKTQEKSMTVEKIKR